jgi:VIT1/CCC1 family predicted Fe2+/Mn2+ transporter
MNSKMVNKDPATQRESITDLLKQLANNLSAAVHNEIELVIQRIREKERTVRSGALIIVTGVAIGFAAFLSLCSALFIELTAYMAPVFAALVTGAVLAFIGVVIAVIGYRQLKKTIPKM